MIDKNLVPVKGLKKEPFSGSHFGMRYLFQADEEGDTFSTYVYPEPWALSHTKKEDIVSKSFPITDAGMEAAVEWLYEMYELQKAKWQQAAKASMHIK